MPDTSPNIFRLWISYERAVLSAVKDGIRERLSKSLASHAEKITGILATGAISGVITESAWIGVITSLSLLGLWVVFVYITTPAKMFDIDQRRISAFKKTLEQKQITEQQGKELASLWRRGQEMYERRLPQDLDYAAWKHELITWASEVVLKLHSINQGEAFIFESAGASHRQSFNLMQEVQWDSRRKQLGDRLDKLRRMAGRYLEAKAEVE